MNLSYINPFSDKFLQSEPDRADVRELETRLNSYGKSEDSVPWPKMVNGYLSSPNNPYDQNCISFDMVFQNKRQRVNYYRYLAKYPFVKKCIHTIVDECVCENSQGDISTFGLNNAYKKKFKVSEFKSLKDEFDYVINCVIGKKNMWHLFKKWLIDSELFLEICLNNEKNKVAGIKALPPYCTMCVWNEGMIEGFIEDPKLIVPDSRDEIKKFTKYQIAYANYGDYGSNMNDVRGHLEPVIRPINQLKAIEDALVIYRLTRAPERRIWKIYGGKVTNAKLKEYLQEVRSKVRKELSIDPETGSIVGGNSIHALSEDIWLTKDADGQGSEVENFKGSTEFNGQLDDVAMFKQQIAEALMIPNSRWKDAESGGAQYIQGSEGLPMDEATFQKECKRLRQQFSDIIKQIFIRHLQVRGYKEKYLDSAIYDIDLIPATDFEKMKDLAMAEKRGGVIGSISQFIPTLENSKATSESLRPIFSKQFMLEKLLGFDTNDLILNNQMIEREIEELNKTAESVKDEGGENEEEDDMEF